MRLYKANENTEFTLLHCWTLLRNEAKWHDTVAEKEKKKTLRPPNKRKENRAPEESANTAGSERYDL